MPSDIEIPAFLDLQTYLGVAPFFIEELEASLIEIELSVKNKNLNKLSAVAHKLKGSAASFGAKKIQEIGEKLEVLTFKEDFEKMYGLSKKLEVEVENFQKALRKLS